MKKIILKITAIIIIISLCGFQVFAIGEKASNTEIRYLGDINDDGRVTSIDARWVLQFSSGNKTFDELQFKYADINTDGKITALDARWVLQTASGTRSLAWFDPETGEIVRPPEYTLSDALSLLQTETEKISKKGGYSVDASCEYTKNVDVGKVTTILLNKLIEQVIQIIDPSLDLDLDKIFGIVLGIEDKSYTLEPVTDDGVTRSPGRFDIVPMTLQTEDISMYRQEGTRLYFQLKNCNNPNKDGSNPLCKVTNSFIGDEEYKEIFTQAGQLVAVEKFNQAITDITLVVNVEKGKITEMKLEYSDSFDFSMVIDPSALPQLPVSPKIPVKGTAATKTQMQYTNFVY